MGGERQRVREGGCGKREAESEGGRVWEERQRVREGGCGRREAESEGGRVWEERGRE